MVEEKSKEKKIKVLIPTAELIRMANREGLSISNRMLRTWAKNRWIPHPKTLPFSDPNGKKGSRGYYSKDLMPLLKLIFEYKEAGFANEQIAKGLEWARKRAKETSSKFGMSFDEMMRLIAEVRLDIFKEAKRKRETTREVILQDTVEQVVLFYLEQGLLEDEIRSKVLKAKRLLVETSYQLEFSMGRLVKIIGPRLIRPKGVKNETHTNSASSV